MKNSAFLKLLSKLLVGPAAGALGLYLLTEAPPVYHALCGGGL